MLLGDILATLGDETAVTEAILGLDDLPMLAAVRQQAPGDEPARVAEPAGHDVDARLAQAVVMSIKKESESGRRQATPASRGPR